MADGVKRTSNFMQSAAINLLLLTYQTHGVKDEWHPLADIHSVNSLQKQPIFKQNATLCIMNF